jgi:hypothetical protein
MRLSSSLLAPLFLAACSSNQPGGPAPQTSISSREYDLIAAAILAETTTIFSLDSTSSISCPITVDSPVLSANDCADLADVTAPVPWAAFLAVNKYRVPISASALSRRGIQVKGPGPSIAQATCPVGPALIWITRAAFSPDSSMALLSFHIFAGRGASFNGCGFSGGGISLWEQSADGKWRRVRRYTDSMS